MAAAVNLILKMRSEIMCGICRIYFSQPVTIDCGHSFCRACISWSWRAGTSPFSCPECRRVCQTRKLPELNVTLEKLTDKVRQLSSHFLQSTEEQNQCPIHQKVLKLFCEEDQTALCVLCSQTPEHEAHKLSPVAEAAHNYRRKLQGILNRVGKDFEEAKKLLSQVEKEMERPLVDWNQMIMGEYYNLHHFLMEEELQCLERLKEEQRTSKDRVSQHIHNLWEIMSDLRESRHKPTIELLKNFRELLGRSKSVFSQRPKAVIPDLMEHPITGMMDILNKFRVDIRVNPQSASSYVIVSEDLKSMRAGEGWEMNPDHPENFACHFVSAEQAFSSGRQYWEVDVAQVPQWGLGVRTAYLRGSSLDPFASVFLLCCVKKGNNYYFQTYPGQLNYQMKDPVPRVGVYLEHTAGTLLFYNVVKRSLIYRFNPISFTELVTPIFSPGPPLPGTKAGLMAICPVNSHLCACCYSSL